MLSFCFSAAIWKPLNPTYTNVHRNTNILGNLEKQSSDCVCVVRRSQRPVLVTGLDQESEQSHTRVLVLDLPDAEVLHPVLRTVVLSGRHSHDPAPGVRAERTEQIRLQALSAMLTTLLHPCTKFSTSNYQVTERKAPERVPDPGSPKTDSVQV